MRLIALFPSIVCTVLCSAQVQPQSPLVEAYQQFIEACEQTPFSLVWQSLGPVVNSARVEAVQLDPTKPGTMYVAFGSGNLWKTVNHGVDWTPLLHDVPFQGIGDIALAPSDANILYLGSGESLKKPRNFTMPGTGVYRSDDAGHTWRHLGLDDAWHIGEIAVHPADPDRVAVAVQGHFWSPNPHRGVYVSMDGGTTFTHTLYVSDSVGANDIVFAPSDPRYLYASLWENHPGIAGNRSGVFRSADGGATWEPANNGLPQGPGTGRIGLAVSYQDPLKVYALIDNLNRDRKAAAEVYRTTDGGVSWQRTHQDTLFIFPGIGWYFTDIYVSPKDDQEVYALGVRLAHSTDGGATFELIQGHVAHVNPSPAQRLHLDHCELWIHPEHPEILALGNDGGFYLSYDKGKSWTHFNNIPTGEFYDISLGPGNPYTIYGGTQDNATVFGPPVPHDYQMTDPWRYLWIDAWSGGDGCMTYVDPSDDNTVYFSLQHGAVRRKDMLAGTSISIRPELDEALGCEAVYNFVAPYLVSQHEPRTLYLAGNFVFKSADRGDHWRAISPDLTLMEGHLDSRSWAAGALAESPLTPGLLYAGLDHGEIFMTKDDGSTWEDCSAGLPEVYVRSICPSRHSSGTAYVALTGMNYDDLSDYLFASDDFGKHWRDISGNLPSAVVNVIVEDPEYEDILYTGTLHGVYVSLDRGGVWSLLGKDAAVVSIADLEIHPATGDLVIATHGRGIYKTSVRPVHWMYENLSRSASTTLLPVDTVRLPRFNDTHSEVLYHTLRAVPITFALSEHAVCTLSIKDGDQTLWSVEVEGRPGLNQYLWDLIVATMDSPKPYHVHYNRFLRPGRYSLTLQAGEEMLQRPLLINAYRKD